MLILYKYIVKYKSIMQLKRSAPIRISRVKPRLAGWPEIIYLRLFLSINSHDVSAIIPRKFGIVVSGHNYK